MSASRYATGRQTSIRGLSTSDVFIAVARFHYATLDGFGVTDLRNILNAIWHNLVGSFYQLLLQPEDHLEGVRLAVDVLPVPDRIHSSQLFPPFALQEIVEVVAVVLGI